MTVMLNRLTALAILALIPFQAVAQTNIALGGITADPTAPVEITADQLTVDQDSRSATFSGSVLIGQGSLRVSAETVEVVYDEGTGQIARLTASGGVTFATETEAAEAQNAVYDLLAQELTLTGDVLLTQGNSALSAESMVVNLQTGTARMDGRVRTVFEQGAN
jgi:lipopolysaccharide export system protein LptA